MESPTHVNSTSNNSKNHNDLTNIRGIGVSWKRWLNAQGIYAIADLSQASADVLESQLKHDGRLLSRSELEEWIAQAQAATNLRGETQHELTELSPEIKHLVPSVDWTSVATFKVDYQTRQTAGKLERRTIIHHFETDITEKWADFETHLTQPWMVSRIETFSQSNIETAVPEITQLRLIQPCQAGRIMIADKTHSLFAGSVQANQPFALEISIQFAELANADLHEQVTCRVQCFVYDISTATTTRLGEAMVNVSLGDDLAHTVLLSELMLPHASIYRLKVSVTPQNNLAANAEIASEYFKVPILQAI